MSLGCPKNLVGNEVMTGLMQAQGHVITADPEDAEILVINTCSFIRDSREESIEAILAEDTNLNRCGPERSRACNALRSKRRRAEDRNA